MDAHVPDRNLTDLFMYAKPHTKITITPKLIFRYSELLLNIWACLTIPT